MKAVVYNVAPIPRGRVLGQAMAKGIALTDEVEVRDAWMAQDGTPGDVCIAYGLICHPIFSAYQRAGKPWIVMDMGYWNRKPDHDKKGGHHKVSVNAAHPTKYFRMGLPDDRFKALGVEIKPWKTDGSHILIAGMSAKSAKQNGYSAEEWERRMIERLLPLGKPIIYRPKPSFLQATELKGARFSPKQESLQAILDDCWLVVTHHSNVAVDALMQGIPVYAEQGAGSALSMPSPEAERVFPEGREQFAADLAYAQWTPKEMASGLCWQFLKTRVLA